MKASNTQLRFPFRLHQMLEDAERDNNDHILSWLPCGTMFKIHDHKDFANRVMPQYCRHSRYKSFLRQLSMYKFQRRNEGKNRGAYSHPNFQRGRFDLIEFINRKERNPMSKNSDNETQTSQGNDILSMDVPDLMDLPENDFELFGDLKSLVSSSQKPSLGSMLPAKPDVPTFLKKTVPACFETPIHTPADILDEIINTFTDGFVGSSVVEHRMQCV